MRLKEILTEIARANGVTVKEVEAEMQLALNEAWQNPPNDTAAAYQRTVPYAGAIPTPEEFIRYIAGEIKRNI